MKKMQRVCVHRLARLPAQSSSHLIPIYAMAREVRFLENLKAERKIKA